MSAKTTNLPTITTEQDAVVANYGTDKNVVVTVHCGKCGGSGYIRGFEHVENGVCFECEGVGVRERVTVGVLLRRAKARDRREAKRQAAEMEREQEMAQKASELAVWLSENAEMVKRAEAVGVTWQTEWNKVPTEKMVSAWVASIEKAEQKAETLNDAGPLTAGRREIVGKIVSAKSQLDTYSYQERYVHKMLVETAEGHRIWGTIPTSIADVLYYNWRQSVEFPQDFGPDCWLESTKGVEVAFTATVDVSDDDENFGFFKRPAKGRVVIEEEEE